MPSQVKIVYLIRHGETSQNNARIFQDDSAVLNQVGKKQAEKLGSELPDGIEVVLVSPLIRAQETARIMTKDKTYNLEVLSQLAEFKNPPAIRGKSYDDLEASSLYEDWRKKLVDEYAYGLEDIENYFDLIERAKALLNSIVLRNENTIAIVTHSELIRAILAVILMRNRLTPHTFAEMKHNLKITNTAITKIQLMNRGDEPTYGVILE